MTDVPSSDVFQALDLVSRLVNLRPGEAVDHKWGYIRREATRENVAGIEVPLEMQDHHWVEALGIRLPVPGFRVADPGQSEAEGNWRGHNAVALVGELYETQLIRKAAARIDGCLRCGTEDTGRFDPDRSEHVCIDCLPEPPAPRDKRGHKV